MHVLNFSNTKLELLHPLGENIHSLTDCLLVATGTPLEMAEALQGVPVGLKG